jgi:hypothetical protein
MVVPFTSRVLGSLRAKGGADGLVQARRIEPAARVASVAGPVCSVAADPPQATGRRVASFLEDPRVAKGRCTLRTQSRT